MGAVAELTRFLDDQPRAHHRDALVTRFSRHSLDRAIQSGAALRVAPGIYVGSCWHDDIRARVNAASLWGGSACAIGGAAALSAYLGFARSAKSVTVVTSRPNHRVPPLGVRLRRLSLTIEPFTVDGMRVVPPIDALILGWSEIPPRERIGATLDLMRTLDIPGHAALARLAHYPRVRDRRSLTALLSVASEGVTSYLEYRARTRVFAGPRFAAFEWQGPVRAGGRAFVVDMVDRATGVAVELDGRAFHGDDVARRRDLERDALLAAAGYVVLRLTYEDVVGRPAWCRTQVRRAVAARGGDSGGHRSMAVQ